MRIIQAQGKRFIIDLQDAAQLPIVCCNKKELHDEIDILFPDE